MNLSRAWLIGVFVLSCGSALRAQAGGEGDGPPIDISCIGLMAPAVVHVKTMPPRDSAGNFVGSPFDYRYEWDFGDPAGKWNNLPGWNAAHVYDKPGKYTVTLTVRAASGRETHRTTWVRVASDERKRIYVSAEGNDALDGANPARAVRTAPHAFQLSHGDSWVLFRRGDTFDISAPIHVIGRGLRVGNYSRSGEGSEGVKLKPPPGAVVRPVPQEPLPVLRKIAGPPRAESLFYIQNKSEDTLFEGIEFDSIWDLKSEYGIKKIPARAFTVGGTNFAVRWCSFRNLTDAVNTEMKPTGVLVQDSRFSQEIRGYCVYANGYDHAYIGNVMIHSRQEHLIRATEPGVTRVLIAYNELSRPNKIKGCIELRCASWFCVAGNYINNGTLRVGPQEQDKAQYPAWRDIKCEWGIVQDNRLDELFFNVRLGTYHLVFRNNVIRNEPKTGAAHPEDGDWAMIVECEKPGYDDVRKVVDVRLEHNTIINHSGHGHLLYLHGKPQGLIVRNNVYITDGKPGNADGLYLSDGSLEGIDAIQNNIYPTGAAGVHHIGGQSTDHNAWQSHAKAKAERYGQIPVDADDNVPLEVNAGARLGSDKRERERRSGKSE